MSYCRIGPDSDVYVYASGAGGMSVHVNKEIAPENRPRDRFRISRPKCLTYLLELREAGLKVPERALERLRNE